jgi:hypothetical protein
MSDDMNKRGPRDRSRIALGEEHEVKYWTKELGVSREELEQAVESVGNTVTKVREHLGSKGQK